MLTTHPRRLGRRLFWRLGQKVEARWFWRLWRRSWGRRWCWLLVQGSVAGGGAYSSVWRCGRRYCWRLGQGSEGVVGADDLVTTWRGKWGRIWCWRLDQGGVAVGGADDSWLILMHLKWKLRWIIVKCKMREVEIEVLKLETNKIKKMIK